MIRIVQTTLEQESQLGENLTSAKDFLDAHERLYDDMQSKERDVERIVKLSNDLQGSSDIVADDVDRKVLLYFIKYALILTFHLYLRYQL